MRLHCSLVGWWQRMEVYIDVASHVAQLRCSKEAAVPSASERSKVGNWAKQVATPG